MAILNILTYPDPELKKISKPVEKVDHEIITLIDNMFETMYAAPGIGLAAAQVGVLKRIIVLDIGERDGGQSAPLALINPEIVSSTGETTFEEGCLSVPEFTADVVRAKEVKIKGIDRKGETVEIEAGGLLAIALQHEIDHLDGILFVDRLGLVKRDIFKRKAKKMLKLGKDRI
ncbi:MAG: peptide deformylase [bacterium]|nr:peptide deformylase [bacterium]